MKLIFAAVSLLTLSSPVTAGELFAPTSHSSNTTNWSGAYIGGLISYGTGEWSGDHIWSTRVCDSSCNEALWGDPRHSRGLDGFAGGIVIGMNRDYGAFVFGLEADIAGTNIEWTHSKYTTTNFRWDTQHEMNWMATARLRAGIKAGDQQQWLIYGTGGLAIADVDSFEQPFNLAVSTTAPTAGASSNNTHVGWTIGGGAEFAVTSNISIKGEYLYSHFGQDDYDYKGTVIATGDPHVTDTTPSDITAHQFRVGLNYKF